MDAADEMSRTEVDERIAEKISWLLGDDPQAHEVAARKAFMGCVMGYVSIPLANISFSSSIGGFRSIGEIEILDADVYSGPWHNEQSSTDIVSLVPPARPRRCRKEKLSSLRQALVCNLDFIGPATQPLVDDHRFHDHIRGGRPVENDDEFLYMKEGERPRVTMITETHARHDMCDLIVINPSSIEAWQKDKWPKIDEERVLKAANPSLRSMFNTWAENVSQEFASKLGEGGDRIPNSYMSLLDNYEHVTLHEVS